MQGRHLLLVGAALIAVLVCSSWQAHAAVIAIDFGGEWVKVALVKPGVPMEIVLNKESKRKTAAIVSMRNDERLFGDAALSTGVKYPKSAYWYLQLLLGQKYDSPLVTKYRQWFPYYDMKEDEERGTILFQHDSETAYSPEELVAMILNYTRIVAQDYAGQQQIRDCVITVPVFYTQAQRSAMLYAANLVGLNVLQLMTDAAASALNYGLFRQASFNTTPQYIMFYDVGALSTTASIIEYKKAQVKEGNVANTYPQLAVKGVGYDRLLGGLEIDIRLRDHLARSFDSLKKTKGSVFDSPRAMGKLLKEAKRVKQVLSANTDHYAQVEGLLEDVDFRHKVTREELENMCSDLYDRVQEPVKQALQAADMTMVEMDSVILMGGGTRVPRFQDALLNAVNKPDLGRSLNTDEAAAMGAVYQAAGQTKLFRVKKFIVKDANVFPIAVSFEKRVGSEGEGEEGGEEKVKVVKKTLFQRSNSYPQKKVLTFNRYSKDFPFSIYYTSLGFLSEEEKMYVGRVNLSEVFLVGVADTLSKHSEAEAKGIKAHFRMDDSGILLLDYVESLFEYPPEEEEESTFSKFGSKLFSNFFGGGSSDEDTKGEEEEPSASPPPSEEKKEAEEEEEEGGATNEAEEKNEEEGAVEEEEEEQRQVYDDETKTEEEIPVEEETIDTASQEEEPSEGESGQNEATPETAGDEVPSTEETTPPSDEQEQEKAKDEEPTPDQKSSDSNETAPESEKNVTKEEPKEPPANRTVKVNLTMEVTTLDLTPPSLVDLELSAGKLRALQERDDEKVANEKAKNSLESFMFETRSWLEVAEVVAVSTEEQRGEILSTVGVVSDWFEEEGYYSAETSVYKEKLRELKRTCRSLKKRMEEAEKRPKLIAQMKDSLNLSIGFVSYMKNFTGGEMPVFTEVEITSLTTLINETIGFLGNTLAEFETTPPHEDPPVLSFEFEEQQRKLDREMNYLINKLKSYKPPKPKPSSNASNTTSASNTTTSTEDTPEEEAAAGGGDGEGEKAQGKATLDDDETRETESEAAAEPLELPPADEDLPTSDNSPSEDTDLPTSATRGTPRQDL